MKLKFTCILLVFLFAINARAQQHYNFEALEKKIQEKISKEEIPSVVLGISKNGKVIYMNAFGKADIKNDIPATINTSYQIASVSKVFTATGIMLLNDQNKLNINNSALLYMDGLKFNNKQGFEETVTLRNLLNHTSGLGTYFDIGYEDEHIELLSFNQAFEEFGELHHPPNRISEYSNLGYGLLDHIISNSANQPFYQFMRKNFFEPLGLHHSYVQGYKNGLSKIVEAKKYDGSLNELPLVKNNTPGAGNIYTSISDLIRFGDFHLNKTEIKILSKKSLNEMQGYRNPTALFHYHQNAYYGLGWYVKPDDNGYKVIWHEGGMMGASATLKLIPQENVSVAVIINSANRAVCNEILDELTKIAVPKYEPTPLNESTEIGGYKPISNDESFHGSWSGEVTVGDLKVPISLKINEDGSVIASYLDFTYKSYFTQNNPLPNSETLLMAITNQNSFIGLLQGTLPYSNLRKEHSHLLSLKLLKENEKLRGTIVALPAADREYYAYPFHIELSKSN